MNASESALISLSSAALSAGALLLVVAARLRARSDRAATARGLADLADRVARLEARRPVGLPAVDSVPAEPPRRRTGPPAARPDPPAEAVAGPTLIAVPDLSAHGEAAATAEAGAAFGRRYAAIWSLADAGADAEAIARTTGQPIGQVELILGLRRQIPAAAVPTPVAGRPRPS